MCRGHVKILAVSGADGCTDRILDAFEGIGANIVVREEDSDIGTVSRKVADAVGRNGYDYVIVAMEDHVGAVIELNKQANLRAALCDSVDDIELAKRNSANVIIVRPSQKRFDYLADVWDSKATQKSKGRNTRLFQQKEKEDEKQAREEERKKSKESREEEEPEEDTRQKRKGGIMGRFKDSLGIIDEE